MNRRFGDEELVDESTVVTNRRWRLMNQRWWIGFGDESEMMN